MISTLASALRRSCSRMCLQQKLLPVRSMNDQQFLKQLMRLLPLTRSCWLGSLKAKTFPVGSRPLCCPCAMSPTCCLNPISLSQSPAISSLQSQAQTIQKQEAGSLQASQTC